MNRFQNKDIESKVRRQTNYNICKCKVILEILEYVCDTEVFKNSNIVKNILNNSELKKSFEEEIKDLHIFIDYLIKTNPNKLLFLDRNRVEREFNTQRKTLEERIKYKKIKNELDLLKCLCSCLSHILLTLSWLIRFKDLKDCNDVYYNKYFSPFIDYNNSIKEYENTFFKLFSDFSRKKRVLWSKNVKKRNKYNHISA